jgi:fumarylacetoacetate (FAA) hydrolase family protein
MAMAILDGQALSGVLVGRVWRPDRDGPSLVVVRDGRLVDVTMPAVPTMRDLIEHDDPAGWLSGVAGEDLGAITAIADNTREATRDVSRPWLLAPCDLQAIKACGVTFARSMIERVIEERAAGQPERADQIRRTIAGVIGDSIRSLVPGSAEAARVKAVLQAQGLWSQYLEVGIGPDAEVFTKAQPMSAVGWGASVGILASSHWNNPEPEVVLVVDSRGRTRGATLGNDVNLRDIEGRSALLLGKAKDNTASCAIGPFIRLFDHGFGIEQVRVTTLELIVEGTDGYRLRGQSRMDEISRDPLDLVAQTFAHHQYPDGCMLFTGTLFAPVEDRHEAGQGFTHVPGDVVRIAAPGLGSLENRVALCGDCPPWRFGTRDLMRNLARRGLLD